MDLSSNNNEGIGNRILDFLTNYFIITHFLDGFTVTLPCLPCEYCSKAICRYDAKGCSANFATNKFAMSTTATFPDAQQTCESVFDIPFDKIVDELFKQYSGTFAKAKKNLEIIKKCTTFKKYVTESAPKKHLQDLLVVAFNNEIAAECILKLESLRAIGL